MNFYKWKVGGMLCYNIIGVIGNMFLFVMMILVSLLLGVGVFVLLAVGGYTNYIN